MTKFRDFLNEGVVAKQTYGDYKFEWTGRIIVMYDKKGNELGFKKYPSFTTTQMKMMIADYEKGSTETNESTRTDEDTIKKALETLSDNVEIVDAIMRKYDKHIASNFRKDINKAVHTGWEFFDEEFGKEY